MAEIFFIASDERALDLVESLRIQSSRSLTFETDLAGAVKRLHKENPRYVFIQSSLDGIPCEEIANQARMLVDNDTLLLILLEDEGSPPGFPPPGFAASFRLTSSTAQLTSDVLHLLSEQDFAETTAAPSALVLDDLPDFDIPSFDSVTEPHPAPQWPSGPPEPLVFDAEALKEPPEEKTPEITGSDEIVFFVAAPAPAPPPMDAPTGQAAPPTVPPEPQGAQQKGTTQKSLYPRPDQIYRKPPQLCGEPEKGDEQAAVATPSVSRLKRPLALAGVALLFAAVLFWRFSAHQPEPEVAQKPPAGTETPAAPAAVPPGPVAGAAGAQPLPAFIPRVPVDAAYAAAHPGWERYEGAQVQFRVFREEGRIVAIQALPLGDAEISEGQVPNWFREAAGAEMPAKGTVREADGVMVETRSAGGGAEVAIYRGAQRRILGVVLQLAAPNKK